MCKDASETVQHIVAGCKMQAGRADTERHNQVAGIVYRNICTEYGLDRLKSRWETPQKVVENNRTKLLWDLERMWKVWKVQAKVVLVVIGALGAGTPKLEERLQQILRTTSELSVQKSAVLGAAKILGRTLKLPGLW